MATVSYHSNQSSYPIGIKKKNAIIRQPPPPPDVSDPRLTQKVSCFDE